MKPGIGLFLESGFVQLFSHPVSCALGVGMLMQSAQLVDLVSEVIS